MGNKNSRNPEKEKFWRGVIEDQKKSGLSQAEYCRVNELNDNSFSWWKREIPLRDRQTRRERAAARRAAVQEVPVKSETPSFVPLVLAGTEYASSQQGGLVEIRLPGAAVLVHPGADVTVIRSVILAFREYWF